MGHDGRESELSDLSNEIVIIVCILIIIINNITTGMIDINNRFILIV